LSKKVKQLSLYLKVKNNNLCSNMKLNWWRFVQNGSVHSFTYRPKITSDSIWIYEGCM